MSRRRSHRLTFGAAAAAGAVVFAVAGCQAGSSDNGCQITRQLVLPGTTPLPLLTEVRIDRVGAGFALIGSDATSVRWSMVDARGAVGTEQVFALPADTIRAFYGLAGANTPGDTIIIGVLVPAANGTDAELRFVAAPTDGSAAPPPGMAVVSFGGGADPQTPPLVAMGTSASAMFAGAAWLSPETGLPMYVFLDGQAQVVGGEPLVIDNEQVSGYSCLGFSPGKQELTISYQRAPLDPRAGPSWLIADATVDGSVTTLRLHVAQQLGGLMSCARTATYDNVGSPEYAIVWQDTSGSWLSVYQGPQSGQVKSFPFASSTDFGGPDLQPPLIGLAAFGSDFGVLLARPHAVELWRLDRAGNRRSGSLVFPSLQGEISGVSSTASSSFLTSTYADLTGADMGRRLVIDAVCY
jgi:hypothetical protein